MTILYSLSALLEIKFYFIFSKSSCHKSAESSRRRNIFSYIDFADVYPVVWTATSRQICEHTTYFTTATITMENANEYIREIGIPLQRT